MKNLLSIVKNRREQERDHGRLELLREILLENYNESLGLSSGNWQKPICMLHELSR